MLRSTIRAKGLNTFFLINTIHYIIYWCCTAIRSDLLYAMDLFMLDLFLSNFHRNMILVSGVRGPGLQSPVYRLLLLVVAFLPVYGSFLSHFVWCISCLTADVDLRMVSILAQGASVVNSA